MMPLETVVSAQRDWLRKLQYLSNKPILVQRHESNVWHPWQEDIPCLPFHTRSLLPCELCFDPDTPDWQAMKIGMEKLKDFLDSEAIPYVLAYTGGKGVHLHVFFNSDIPLPDNLTNKLENYHYRHKGNTSTDAGKEIRLLLANWLIDSAKVDARTIALDYGKISWSSASKGSMIRITGSLRENGNYKTVIDAIPEEKPYRLPLRFPEKLELWDISFLQGNIIEHLELRIQEREQAEKERTRDTLKHIVGRGLPGEKKKCPGFRRAEIGVEEGIRDVVATGLICACKTWLRMDLEKCHAFMHSWYRRCTPAFALETIDYKIRRIYSIKQPYPPCGFFRRAGLCEDCRHRSQSSKIME